MAQAIKLNIRAEIWKRKAQGQANVEIAREQGISPRSVKRVLDRGPSKMGPSYDRCGRNGREHASEVRVAAIEMKQGHPGWGGVVIGIEMAKTFARVPSARTLQRWFLKAEVNQKRERAPKVSSDKGKEVHDVWELDAKEQVQLKDASRRSAMMAVDEASGALIDAVTFPPREYQRSAALRRA